MAIFADNQPDEHQPTQRTKRAIDSSAGRRLYSQRIATVEPVFANIRQQAAQSLHAARAREG